MLVEYRRNTHFLDGLEVDFKNFLITRSAGFEGALDINVRSRLKFKKKCNLGKPPEKLKKIHEMNFHKKNLQMLKSIFFLKFFSNGTALKDPAE